MNTFEEIEFNFDDIFDIEFALEGLELKNRTEVDRTIELIKQLEYEVEELIYHRDSDEDEEWEWVRDLSDEEFEQEVDDLGDEIQLIREELRVLVKN